MESIMNNQEAFDEHAAKPYIRAFLDKVDEHCSEPPDIKFLKKIELEVD
jgi:quinol monooxygenase YgiN